MNIHIAPCTVIVAFALWSGLSLADNDARGSSEHFQHNQPNQLPGQSVPSQPPSGQSIPPQGQHLPSSRPHFSPSRQHLPSQGQPAKARPAEIGQRPQVGQRTIRLKRIHSHAQAQPVIPVERVEHDNSHYRSSHWELDTRFRHNHYYPRHGTVVTVLPPDYFSVGFDGEDYYFQGGVWFRNWGMDFAVTDPPPGIIIPVLPPGYTTVWLDSVPYYYANNVYYAPAADASGYVVVDPPADIDQATVQPPPPNVAPIAPETAGDSEPLFIYPRNGQSEDQIQTDQNECNRWATGQTGYVPASGDVHRRNNYQRAMSACMEGRGYTVR